MIKQACKTSAVHAEDMQLTATSAGHQHSFVIGVEFWIFSTKVLGRENETPKTSY